MLEKVVRVALSEANPWHVNSVGMGSAQKADLDENSRRGRQDALSTHGNAERAVLFLQLSDAFFRQINIDGSAIVTARAVAAVDEEPYLSSDLKDRAHGLRSLMHCMMGIRVAPGVVDKALKCLTADKRLEITKALSSFVWVCCRSNRRTRCLLLLNSII